MLEAIGFRLGDVLTIAAFLIGGIIFVVTIRGQVDVLTAKVVDQGKNLKDVEMQLTKLVEILVVQGRHEERMRAQDDRIFAQGQRLDTLLTRFDTYIDRGLMPMSRNAERNGMA